jgi:hypothetical protein
MTSGKKTDNVGSLATCIPRKFWGDTCFLHGRGEAREVSRVIGHYDDYEGLPMFAFVDYISDRVTGRPAKITKGQTSVNNIWFGTNHGTYTHTTTAVVVSNVKYVVAKNSSDNVLAILTDCSPSGGNGSFALDDQGIIKPDEGIGDVDVGAGTFVYTPDFGFVGTDEFYLFVKSGDQYGTVRVNVLVTESGTDGGVTTPVVDTHFSAVGGAGQIAVTLGDAPGTSERRIERVFYQTSGLTSWRRLCQRWPGGAVITITDDSDGVALDATTTGIKIKYRYDHDYTDSPASAEDAVTIT